MGIVQLIDPFYVKLPGDTFRRASIVGQFCWVPVTHLDPIPRILDVERADPQEHYATKFSIRNMTDGDFKKKTRLPIKALSLRETEGLVIHRAKRRPAIIISGETFVLKKEREYDIWFLSRSAIFFDGLQKRSKQYGNWWGRTGG